MSNKKLRTIAAPTVKIRGRLENTPSRSLSGTVIPSVPVSAEPVSQIFSSEEQALEFLVDGIVGKIEKSVEERAEMADFLHLLLDTDPTLREEILSGVSIRKES